MLEVLIEYYYFFFTYDCWRHYIIPFMAGWYCLQALNVMVDHYHGFKRIMKRNIMIVLGSGGHTGEMMRLMENFKFEKYLMVYFVRSSADRNSEIRVRKLIQSRNVKFWLILGGAKLTCFCIVQRKSEEPLLLRDDSEVTKC